MPHTEDPIPRANSFPAESFDWPVISRAGCAPVVAPSSQTFESVVERRRSGRQMAQAPISEIVNVLGFAMRPRFWKDDVFRRTRSLAISAGALHPLSVLIIPGRYDQRLYRYNVVEHCLETLRIEIAVLNGWLQRATEVLPGADGTYLLFTADTTGPNAVYENAESLIWRDAGALLQLVAMVSSSFQLEFCPLGLLGSEIVAMLASPGRLIPAGVAVIGKIQRAE